ncbi:MAG: hypothetical protein PHW69_04290 [Elusimicrobiaceae bacterium]|nr:hypothetical protein [Elusimicrobiaceae bacterium]
MKNCKIAKRLVFSGNFMADLMQKTLKLAGSAIFMSALLLPEAGFCGGNFFRRIFH